MLDIAADLLEALGAGRRLAVATVTTVDGSAPRALGTSMAVDDQGRVLGSISGGCVEGAVYQAAEGVLETGAPVLAEFGFTDGDAFAAGLSCGGRIEVFVHEIATAGARGSLDVRVVYELEATRDGRPAGIAIVVSGRAVGTVIAATASAPEVERDGLDLATAQRILHELTARVTSGVSGTLDIDCDGEPLRVLFVVASTAPRMIIFGAVDFSAALADASSLLGYHVTVCDARPLFATPQRFPSADEVVVAWPSEYLRQTHTDSRTVICVLTHDEKFDVPLLEEALRLPVAFVGAMASRSTHERRIKALEGAGLSAAQLDRLHSPIGLDIGGSTPQETAVSILAEVIASRTGANGEPLRSRTGPIHRTAEAVRATRP
ncbi:xanthine dehydrogenase accessory factor [Agreia bicolorata]|uniref:Xanthine dehydrogenase accessory factor n=1 Tax=Agreia bicolorata TaxID=110935 RepID=A0A1T4YGC2_9MICO|nr:XdhC/CoxI family protein [Agreia bicolorata]SKB00826.1 xanthine dehydrogenase accessory factor [Agreia bicolorata]